MTTRILQLWSLAILLVSASLSPVRAQNLGEADDVELSHSHFDRGVEYVQDGDLKAASIEFKRAYAASPNYRVLYNLGQVSVELREYTDAQIYYKRYLIDGSNEIEPGRRREVDAVLAKLAGRIASLVLSSNIAGAEVYVDDVLVGTTPLSEPVRVGAGARVLSAAVGGRARLTRTIEAAGGDTLVVHLDFPSVVAPEALAGTSAAPRLDGHSRGGSAALWLGIGTGALAVATGIMAYLAANDASKYHDAVKTKTTPRELEDLDERATAKALVADILLGTTIVAATVTVIVATSGSSERSDGAHARVGVGVGSLSLTGDF